MIARCDKHPRYKGKRKPTNNCTSCLNLYLKMTSKPRAPIMPTKVIKDKSKYTRKIKHKNNED